MGILHDRHHPTSSQRDLGQQKQAPPAAVVLRQRRPYRLTGFAHRVIPANEPAPAALRGQVSAVPPIRLNYQRLHVWDIECQFRDSKDIRFGMGMGEVHVSTPARRDRLWLINAFAVALLTLLGAAGEALGFDRMLKSNTTKRRTHSLLRQGIMLYQLIPTMPEHRLLPLVEKFAEMLNDQPVFAGMFGAI